MRMLCERLSLVPAERDDRRRRRAEAPGERDESDGCANTAKDSAWKTKRPLPRFTRNPIENKHDDKTRLPPRRSNPNHSECAADQRHVVSLDHVALSTRAGGGDRAPRARSVRRRHRPQRSRRARQLFGLRLELAAGGENVAAARGAHRRGIAGVENVFGEFFDLVPVRTFVGRTGPGIERDQVDLGGMPSAASPAAWRRRANGSSPSA